MGAPPFVVRPINREEARRLCEDHPHASTLPNSSKYYMAAYLGGRLAGLAVWGYGIRPQDTPRKLFGLEGHAEDYLELCRFFCYDWVPKNTPSRFLAVTHRLLRRYTKVKWLYTYAAGFQGLVGYIYQAAGYDYIGKTICKAFVYVPGKGLIHSIAQWHRFGKNGLKHMQPIFGDDCRTWAGHNFCYIFWICSRAERRRLLKHATFTVQDSHPKEGDLLIWLEDLDRTKTPVSVEFAKTIPIIKLRSSRSKP